MATMSRKVLIASLIVGGVVAVCTLSYFAGEAIAYIFIIPRSHTQSVQHLTSP